MDADVESGAVASDIEYLMAHLGRRFVDWILNEPRLPLTEAQTTAALMLTDALRGDEPITPGFWARRRLWDMADYAEEYGTSALHHLRRQTAGPDALGDVDDAEDPTLRAMQHAAVVMYPGLLLRSDRPLMYTSGPSGAPELAVLQQAIRQDPTLPFPDSAHPKSYVYVYTSTQHAGPVFTEYAGPWIISAAWQFERLKDPEPTLEALLAALPDALGRARTALAGRTVRITAVTSLTGILLPAGTVMDFRWGRIRSARPDDHSDVMKLMQTPIPAMRLESGEEIAINDHGDVVLEIDVPFRYTKREPAPANDIDWPPSVSIDVVAEYVTKARVGLLLALSREVPPVVFPSWQWFIEPLEMGATMGRTSPDRFAQRTATQLTVDEVAAWEDWTRRLDRIDLPRRLGVTADRLLRATAERYDATDRLIDAVICWEAMFGGRTEMTLRVSSSMARLLRPAGSTRRRLRAEISDIYDLRSSTVHGSPVDPEKIETASRRAMALALEAARALVTDTSGLLNMPSVERSLAIILS